MRFVKPFGNWIIIPGNTVHIKDFFPTFSLINYKHYSVKLQTKSLNCIFLQICVAFEVQTELPFHNLLLLRLYFTESVFLFHFMAVDFKITIKIHFYFTICFHIINNNCCIWHSMGYIFMWVIFSIPSLSYLKDLFVIILGWSRIFYFTFFL